jgi:hypothetical protein
VFAHRFGFPVFYGRNLNACIDCMTCLDDPWAGMSSVRVEPGQTLSIAVENAGLFQMRCLEVWDALIECAGFVNERFPERAAPLLVVVVLPA